MATDPGLTTTMHHLVGNLRRFESADLRLRNSFQVAARAALLLEVEDAALLPLALDSVAAGSQALILGGGSNVLFASDPIQTIIVMRGARISWIHDEGDVAVVRAEAGADWHQLVLWTLKHGLCGLENLALIPGTVGAAPIQNIGAYGREVGDYVHAVEAFERTSGRMHRLDKHACGFSYRDSVFKHAPDRWIITALELRLSRTPQLRLDYPGIGAELVAMGVQHPTPQHVADAVVRIRRRKLPDPSRTGNAGSFFKNPIVTASVAADLHAAHPGLPVFHVDNEDARKLSAAWLIEQCGWKGYRDGDAGVSDQHALVLVNHGHASGAQLLALARRIATSVHERFGVKISPEPRIIGDQW